MAPIYQLEVSESCGYDNEEMTNSDLYSCFVVVVGGW